MFQGCGQAEFGPNRMKRDANRGEIHYQPLDFSSNRNSNSNWGSYGGDPSIPSITKLVREIKSKVSFHFKSLFKNSIRLEL